MKAALFWSGGKDAAYALYKMQNDYPGIEIKYLVTTISEEHRRVSMHGIREELIERQAEAAGVPLYKMLVPNIPDNQVYEIRLKQIFDALKQQGIETVVFGDILLEDLKAYREKLLQDAGLKGLFPLWKKDTRSLIADFTASGFQALTCCVDSVPLNEDFLGKTINPAFLRSLPANVDPCGENGEFHTFCFAGPVFSRPVPFALGKKEFHPMVIKMKNKEIEGGFWYIDLL